MITKFTQENIEKAIQLLKSGEVLGLPTETVYGLAADANNEDAIKKIYALKQRPANNPLIVHIAHMQELRQWAIDIPETAYQLAHAFWPGALTLVLKKAPHVSPIITAGQDSIAIRCPNHPVAQAILQKLGSGLVAPSANKFTQLSPSQAEHVEHTFGDELTMIMDGGQCGIGIESTIVSLLDDTPTILRAGMITSQQIDTVLQNTRTVYGQSNSTLKTPGMHTLHYAPKTPLMIMDKSLISSYLLQRKNIVVLSLTIQPCDDATMIMMPKSPENYAKQLYTQLHNIDQKHYETILVEAVPGTEEWYAIADRLSRAKTR